ncbi:hypothetical protein Pla175_31770 [Pirellulimonas nuda]|uniref:Uncharacterized protein n=1 Tax=Pirellulimonas nuda TaxID=2528009 RepID=A0A518DEC4_9BACT|nr:hypothetical protein [Pirellulimonas nuda]QDU89782.1 hypothetical protein Pla175_31770 [Pirellulimonas nuda]
MRLPVWARTSGPLARHGAACPKGTIRRGAFEQLEERAMLSVVRIASWNTLNGPNDAEGQAAFATVLGATGEASLAGNASVDLSGWLLDDEDAANWSPIPARVVLAIGLGGGVVRQRVHPRRDVPCGVAGADGRTRDRHRLGQPRPLPQRH